MRWRKAIVFVLVVVLSFSDAWNPRFLRKDRIHTDGYDQQSNQEAVTEILPYAEQLRSIILYKPPVGIVAVVAMLRLVVTGRLFRVSAYQSQEDEGYFLQPIPKRYRKHDKGFKYGLDSDDQHVLLHGGVEGVRRTLCLSILKYFSTYETSSNSLQQTIRALSVARRPKSSRISFVLKLAPYLEKMRLSQAAAHSTLALDLSDDPKVHQEDINHIAAKITETRALDALLRSCRDRLLRSSSRLKRSRAQSQSSLKWYSSLPTMLQPLTTPMVDRYREQLSMADAAYERELTHLGQVLTLLMMRPPDMTEMDILKFRRQNQQSSFSISRQRTAEKARVEAYKAWMTLGGGETLQLSAWLREIHAWTSLTRLELGDILSDEFDDASMKEELEAWSEYRNDGELKNSWNKVVVAVAGLDDNGRTNRSVLGATVERVVRQIDIFGIPSSLALVGLALLAHHLLAPNWEKIMYIFMKFIVDVVWTVFRRRVWDPFVLIVVEYTRKKDSSLLEFLDVENEIQSLDNMLRDLGFGEGTPEDRDEGLRLAAREYEKELNQGFYTNMLWGRLNRLILMQVQQLKAGLLRALGDIDGLVQANVLNVRLLAAIPAFVIITLTTRFLLRAVLSIRLQDIRPLRQVHQEMNDYLYEMEQILLSVQIRSAETSVGYGSTKRVAWSRRDLGLFALQMHSYLVLLEFCAPAFPSQSCAFIRKSLRELLDKEFQDLRSNQQVALLRLIREKHADLSKTSLGV